MVYWGGRSSVGRALDCGSSGRGFEPHRPPSTFDGLQRCLGSGVGGCWEFCWDFFVVLVQNGDGRPFVFGSQMGIPKSHVHPLMPHQFLHGRQVDSPHNETRRKSMAEVMKRDIRQSCSATCSRKILGNVSIRRSHASQDTASDELPLPRSMRKVSVNRSVIGILRASPFLA